MPSGRKRMHEDFVSEVSNAVGEDFSVLGKYVNAKTKILIQLR